MSRAKSLQWTQDPAADQPALMGLPPAAFRAVFAKGLVHAPQGVSPVPAVAACNSLSSV